ncbi:MAG: hypothetical protein CTY15_02835 [Methylocystis sp.]|nr:MAG: hypothetical protein CTY15_02835 [Methylocystis sp.]
MGQKRTAIGQFAGNELMPRLGLSINESFDNRPKAPKSDQYGRRVRTLDGVRVAGEREAPPVFTSTFARVTLTLTLIATIATALAMWRLFTFHH